MTDAGYDWFKRVCLCARYVPDGAQRREVASFWIAAFHALVRHTARVRCEHDPEEPCRDCIAKAFEEMADDTREMP